MIYNRMEFQFILMKGMAVMKKKILCLALAAACVLSGCGKKTDENDVVATVGDVEITMSEFEFYLENVKQQMQGTELSSDEDWKTKDIDGKKAIEIAKEQAIDIAAKNVAYKMIYEKMGKTITDENKAAIEETKNNIVTQYDQAGGYEAFLTNANITDEFVDMLCESMFCSEQLYTEFVSSQNVTDDEINAFYDENYDLYFSSYRRAKHVLILTKNMETNEEYSEDKKAEAKKKAEEIFQRAKKGENFDSLVSKYSEDPGSATNPEGYTFTDGEMVKEFQDCVDSLAPGEIGFVESSFGYHIIQRLDVDKSYFAENIKARILSTKFDEYIEQKMEEYGLDVQEKDAMKDALE